MKSLLFSACILSLFTIPLFSHAQISGLDVGTPLSVSISPQYPPPYSTVKVQAVSYSFDINSADITWTLDGKTISSGVGHTQISVLTGSAGIAETLTVSVVPVSSAPVSQTLSIMPAEVNFLTEAQTFTPPFYEGKAPYTAQAPITITAIPQVGGVNGLTDPAKLIYKWTDDDTVLPNQSGYGKQSVVINGNFWGRDEHVTVDVSTQGGEVVAENTLTLHPRSPSLLVYDNDPLLGLLLNTAVSGTFGLAKNTEASFFAAPYGFVSSLLPKTTYSWTMNGAPIAGSDNTNTVTFRSSDNVSGTSNIAVSANQPSTNFENASNGFSITF